MNAGTRVGGETVPRSHHVVILTYDDVDLLELSSASEVFTQANRLGGRYCVTLVAPTAREVRTASGMRLRVDGLDDTVTGVDTLVIPGAAPWLPAVGDRALLEAARHLDARSHRTIGIGSGTLVLAETGALDGRHVVAHWSVATDMAVGYPNICVDETALYFHDDKYVTCSGGAATIDVTLSLLEADGGADLAVRVARRLLVHMARPSNHPQLSLRLRTRHTPRHTLRPVLDAVTADPAAPHSVPAMAALIDVSARHLGRLFVTNVGLTPMQYVDLVRLEAACAMLSDGTDPLDTIAARCGIGTSESLRRLFRRELGTTPSAYRLSHRLSSAGEFRPMRALHLPPHHRGEIHGCHH